MRSLWGFLVQTLTVSLVAALLLVVKELLADKLHELSGGDFTDVPVIVFGPFPAPVYRVDEKYRVRMVIKCRLNGRSRALFARLRAEFTDKARRGPVLSIDFNPTNI